MTSAMYKIRVEILEDEETYEIGCTVNLEHNRTQVLMIGYGLLFESQRVWQELWKIYFIDENGVETLVQEMK